MFVYMWVAVTIPVRIVIWMIVMIVMTEMMEMEMIEKTAKAPILF